MTGFAGEREPRGWTEVDLVVVVVVVVVAAAAAAAAVVVVVEVADSFDVKSSSCSMFLLTELSLAAIHTSNIYPLHLSQKSKYPVDSKQLQTLLAG